MTRGRDALGLATAYLVLAMALPSKAGFAALGTIGAPSTLLSIAILFVWVWSLVRDGADPMAGPQPVRRAGVILMLAALAIYVHAMTQPLPADEITPADSTLLRFLALVGIALAIGDGLATTDSFHRFVGRVVVAGGLVAILAIVQAVTKQMWTDRFILPGLTLDLPQGAGLITRGLFARPIGTATHPIEFGAVMGTILPLALNRARTVTHGRTTAWLWVVTMWVAVLLSVSRTAIVCSVVGLLLLVPTWPRRAKIAFPFVFGAGVVVLGSIVPGLVGTLQSIFTGSGDDPSVASRTESYAYAFDLMSRNPWFGRGLGTYLPRYRILDNGYLGLGIEGGAIGVLAFLGLVGTAVLCALSARRRFTAEADRETSQAIVASVVSGALAMFFYDQLGFAQAAGMVFVSIGLAGAAHRLAGRGTAPVRPILNEPVRRYLG